MTDTNQANQVLQGDCLELMKDIPDGSVDMVITSPPYDNLRSYKGSLDWGEHIWKPVLSELYRVVKQGGVVVWVVGDSTIKGSETGTSFRQALYAKDVGFNLHDTMIYRKQNPITLSHNRYEQEFEYMFVLSKGRPATFNPLKVACKTAGRKYNTKRPQVYDMSAKRHNREEYIVTKTHKIAGNIWNYTIGTDKKTNTSHTAPFPLKLAQDHISTWSNEGGVILDPFAGSGTTGVACQNLNRNFILMEQEPEYVEIIKQRLELNKEQRNDQSS